MVPAPVASLARQTGRSRPPAFALALLLLPQRFSGADVAAASSGVQDSRRQPRPCTKDPTRENFDLSCLVQWDLSVGPPGAAPRRALLQQPAEEEEEAPKEQREDWEFWHGAGAEGDNGTQFPLDHFPLFRNSSVLKPMGMARNGHGDFGTFIGAFFSNCIVLTACAALFSTARVWFPQIYSNNVRSTEEGGFASAPFTPSDRIFGWVPAGLFVTVEQAKVSAGLDSALLLEYSNFCMKLLVVLGVPLLLVLSPLHYWCGGKREDSDRLTAIGLNNIEDGSWLFGFHAVVVWFVVLATQHMLFASLRRFLNLRFQWLEALGPPRSTTVLVEGLPERLRSEGALAGHFARYFPHEAVESAYVVKHTDKLKPLVAELKWKCLALEKASYKKSKREAKLREEGSAEDRQKLEAEVKSLTSTIRDLETEVEGLKGTRRAEHHRILEAAGLPLEEAPGEPEEGQGGKRVMVLSDKAREVCASSGFVTFANEREAMLAMSARCSADSEDMVLSIPPSPTDIRYDDLVSSPVWQNVMAVIGYTLIVGLFVGYMPFIAVFSTLTQLENLEKIKAFHNLMVHAPTLATLLEGFFSTLGIVLFMSLLPTILMWIFRQFFTLKADAWAQQRLQTTYFWFLVVFVLLVTAVGASLLGRVMYLAKHPMETSGVLADSLPTATHFYLNYLLMQWVVHAMNLTRYIQLGKFLFFRAVVGEQRAVELAEPEDQDYYGLGARTARWSLDLMLALVFCSITPLMTLVAFVNFLITRVVYGYLLVFAETRKNDLGGPFFMEQMKHVQYGLLVYVVLMMGVFARRASSWYPTWVAGFALLPVLYGFKRLYSLAWETLTLEEVTSDDFQKRSKERHAAYQAQGAERARYVQPELSEDDPPSEGLAARKL